MATLKNTTINDTGFLTLPPGTTAQRPASPVVGMIRYNTTLGFAEQYNADGWQGIAPPPTITSISPSSFNGEGGTTITINGSNFDTTAAVQFVLNTGTIVNATTTTRVSSSQLTATTPRDFIASESPADIRVNNGSGLFAIGDNLLSFADVPVFNTAAGSLGQIYDSNRGGYTLSSAAATDAAGGSIASYAIVSGAVPPGLSFNTSTAAITGTANAVGTDTTSSFTIRATDNAGNTTDRAFSITVRAPVVQSFTSTGAQTFNVPVGVNQVEVLLIGGGGGGGASVNQLHETGGGGGAGGLIYRPGFSVTPGGSVPLNVGGGGSGGTPPQGNGSAGGDTGFGPLTARGGGYGGGAYEPGGPGGSGGGSSPANGSGSNTGQGPATQPGQPGDSGTFGFGNPGGGSRDGDGANQTAAGGGGAGGAGQPGQPNRGGAGGTGRTYTISGSSVGYAGGGGGAGSCSGSYPPGPSSDGGGTDAAPGTSNRGGGGGGGRQSQNAGSGGSGVVIVRY